MTRPRILWVCAALLACVVAAELSWPDAGTDAPPPPRAAAAPAPRAVRPPDATGEWVDALLARPPFAVDRRPVAGAAVATGPAAPLPRLAGILVNGNERSALFATEGGRAVVAREGAKLGVFAVRTIHADGVLVDGPDGPRTLRPSFAKLDSTVPPPPTSPAMPWMRARMGAQNSDGSPVQLPPLPSTDTIPFNQMTAPSGAPLFGNGPLPGRYGR